MCALYLHNTVLLKNRNYHVSERMPGQRNQKGNQGGEEHRIQGAGRLWEAEGSVRQAAGRGWATVE